MAVVHKVGHSPCNAPWVYKGCYLFPDEYKTYTVMWNLQKRYKSLVCLVATVIEFLKLFFRASIFQFFSSDSTRVGRFFIN